MIIQGRLDLRPLLAITSRPPPLYELLGGVCGVGLRACGVFRWWGRWRRWQAWGDGGDRKPGRLVGSRGERFGLNGLVVNSVCT